MRSVHWSLRLSEARSSAEASGTMTPARVRSKVRQGLAQRFLIKDGATVEMPFERLRDRIDSEWVMARWPVVSSATRRPRIATK